MRTAAAITNPGVYAAGDVIEALDQISVKTGPGAMAAMRLHDWIREQNGYDQK